MDKIRTEGEPKKEDYSELANRLEQMQAEKIMVVVFHAYVKL